VKTTLTLRPAGTAAATGLAVAGMVLLASPQAPAASPKITAAMPGPADCTTAQRAQDATVNLREADLYQCDLAGKDLSFPSFQGKGLGGANLSGADLRKANLRGVNLYLVNLSGANLRGAQANAATIWPPGFNPTAAGVTR
jgi:hypothetical protein